MILDDKSLSLHNAYFDLIFISGVYHHIPADERENVTEKIYAFLKDKGSIICFEHNPYNPLTRQMVNTCIFDDDAVLLTKEELEKTFLKEKLSVVDSGYTLFVPPKLKALNFIEKYLKWLPLGGQYYVAFKKK